MNEEKNIDVASDFQDDRPLEPQPGDLTAVLPTGVKLSGPVDFLLNAACTDYIKDGRGAFEAVKALPEITVLDLFKFSGLTTAAWAEGLGIAEVTWYKYRNRQEVPAELRENAFALAMEARAAVRGLRSGAAARKLRQIIEIINGRDKMKYSVNIYTWDQQGYQDKVVVEATVEAENPRAALQEVLDHWDLGYDCPREVGTVFEESSDELHAMNGKYSYDVCPAEW